MHDAAEEFLIQINSLRTTYGLNLVQHNNLLREAACMHALDMVKMGKMQHKGSDGSNFEKRILRAHYHFFLAEENIAFGPTTGYPFEIWRNSPPHRKNMLNSEITEIGFAAADGFNHQLGYIGTFWSLSLAAPLSAIQSTQSPD